jgi:hypothetical protein
LELTGWKSEAACGGGTLATEMWQMVRNVLSRARAVLPAAAYGEQHR